MAVVNDKASLYAAQEANGFPSRWEERSISTGEAAYYSGKMFCFHSRLAAVTGGGEAGDTIQLMKLPDGAIIVGGWLYIETGLGGSDAEDADLGVIYEDGNGTDDPNCLLDNIDIYDGADMTTGQLVAGGGGFAYLIGSLVGLTPYQVTGGKGTVTLTSTDGDFVTAKDVVLTLFVIMP